MKKVGEITGQWLATYFPDVGKKWSNPARVISANGAAIIQPRATPWVTMPMQPRGPERAA